MEVVFDFRKEKSGLFGTILRPVARVLLRNGKNLVQEVFYVDSGADVSLIPRSVGELLGFDNPTPDEIIDIKGIGDKTLPIVVRRVTMTLGDIKLKCRIGWSLVEEVPPLLGREDVFKYFDVVFHVNKRTVFKS